MEDRGLRSNEKVNGQLDYQMRKMVSPQTDVNVKKENSNPMDQNGSTYQLKGYERQAPYSSNLYDQNHQIGDQSKLATNNHPYLKQSQYNNPDQGKPIIRQYQEGDQRRPLDQVNYKQDVRQPNQREINSPYVNIENQKRDPLGSRTPFDPRANLSAYTPQSRQDNYRRDAQLSDYKREFQLPEYRRMYPEQDPRIPQRQMNSIEMQKPIDQGDRLRYNQERIRTQGGQLGQPDRMIRASDYVRKSDYQNIQEYDRRALERREFDQRGGVEQIQRDQRNNTSKSQEYSQRSQNLVIRPQEGSKTPIEGRMIERRGFDNHPQIQQNQRFSQQSQYPYAEHAQHQQFYEQQTNLVDQRRMRSPYEERRNLNSYDTKQQVQNQRTIFESRPNGVEFENKPDQTIFERGLDRPQYDRIPDRLEFEKRPDRPEYERRLDRTEIERRPDRSELDRRQDRFEFERRLERPEFERRLDRPGIEGKSPYQARFVPGLDGRLDSDYRPPADGRQFEQGQNNQRYPLQEYKQGLDGKYHNESKQVQRTQLEERPGYCPDGIQDTRQGMNSRKYSDGRAILDGRVDNKDRQEVRSGIMEGRQYQFDGRGGFNRTYGEDRYQGSMNFEGRPGLDGRREQFGTRPPIQGRTFDERGNQEQRTPIENRNQYQRGYNDKFGDRYFEQKYSQQQPDTLIGRKDFYKPEYAKLREDLDKRNTYDRVDIKDKMQETGKRQEFESKIRPETSFGKPSRFGYQPHYRREFNDQGQRLSYHEGTSVIDRLGLERGTNRNIVGNQTAENMSRGQPINRPYDRERSFNRFGMGERVSSFTNGKIGYQRTAVQDKDEYQGYVRSKHIPKSSLVNNSNEFQGKQSQDKGFQKLQNTIGQVETKVGIYDIQRRDGRI